MTATIAVAGLALPLAVVAAVAVGAAGAAVYDQDELAASFQKLGLLSFSSVPPVKLDTALHTWEVAVGVALSWVEGLLGTKVITCRLAEMAGLLKTHKKKDALRAMSQVLLGAGKAAYRVWTHDVNNLSEQAAVKVRFYLLVSQM